MKPPYAVISANSAMQVNGVLGSSREQRLQWGHRLYYMIIVDLRLCDKQNYFLSIDKRLRGGGVLKTKGDQISLYKLATV